MNYFLATSAIIEKKVAIGEGSEIWYFTHIRETARIGKDCKIGDSCFIDTGVIIGDGVKLANGVKIYGGAIIKDNVYLGPDVKITDVRKPKANKKGKQLDTIIEEGVSVASGATIVGGVRIGKNTQIGENAVVISDLPDGVFAAGNPASIKKRLIQNA